ncbi:MAG: hypothetical protein KF685_11240 [Acidobacteria bacterium]|nr:hypothetical protein [Acidobacteriota bacterium]
MQDIDIENGYPGIGRLNYFLAKVLMLFIIIGAVYYFGPGSGVIGPLSLVVTVASFILDVMRLRNIGVSQWFVFLRFLPYVGLIYWTYLQSAQSGWIETKRFDRAGWAIIATHAAITVILFYILYRMPGMEIFGISF